MKTQILQLEAHDDAISTRDKMGWGQTGRVVLVWPNRGRILTRKLDLVLLQRHSATLGAQLALVTTDLDVCFYARQLHIPVFKTLKEAQSVHWRSSRRRKFMLQRQAPRPDFQALKEQIHPSTAGWQQKPLTRIGFFSLGFISFLAILAILVPGARISLSPLRQIQESTLLVSASPSYQSINLSGELPAQVKSMIVEGQGVLTTTGTVYVPENTATGYVRLTNLTEEPVEAPKGLIITTLNNKEGQLPVRFATTSDGRVPAGSGKSISLPVRALSPGSQGNQPAGSLAAIEGPLGLTLACSNLLPTSGGTDRAAPGPAPSNYRQLEEKLVGSLRQTALNELSSTLAKGDLVITPTLILSDTLGKTFDPPQDPGTISQPAEQLRLTLQARFRVMVVSATDLQQLSNRILTANLAKGFNPLSDTLQVEQLTTPQLEGSSVARWQIRIRRVLQAQLDPIQAIRLSLGLSPDQATQALSTTMLLNGAPGITIYPAWWPRLPVMPFRISIEMQ